MRPASPVHVPRAAWAIRIALVALAAAGCGRDSDTLQPAPPNTDPIVFDDNYGAYATFQAFLGSKVDAVVIDTAEKHLGTASLRITVPGPGDPSGGYAGGAFTTDRSRQLSGYDALTFWAKASLAAELDVAGLGNDNTGTSKYEAKWAAIQLTTNWTKYVIPIPLPEKLESEGGLFFFAEGPEDGMGYQLWLDEIRFESLGTISNPRPSLVTKTVGTFVGATVNVDGAQTVFDVAGSDQTIEHSPGYFAFVSSNDTVATVAGGVIHVVGGGSAIITGKLGAVDVEGAVTVDATAPPATAPPAPAVPAADVISLFSNAYSSVTVDTWSADWDMGDVADARLAGNDVKVYTNLAFAGIEFASQTLDASAMTHFHLDVWVPAGTMFKVKLVDFGADGVYGGGDDREHELTFDASSTPPLTTGTWVGLEIPLPNFVNLTTRAHLAQLILSGDTRTAYVDNVYFHE
jgi:hypothetical protein